MPDTPVKTTYNIQTGETTTEPLTAEEISLLASEEAAAEAAKADAAAVRSSAIAKLEAIGLTEEEIASLLGGN